MSFLRLSKVLLHLIVFGTISIDNARAERPPVGVQSQPAPAPTGKMIDIGERRLHLDCVGGGSPTVVVEAGAGSFSVEWTFVQQVVAPRYRICSYDRAGYAWSDHGPVDEDVAQTVDDLHMLIQEDI